LIHFNFSIFFYKEEAFFWLESQKKAKNIMILQSHSRHKERIRKEIGSICPRRLP